MRASPLITAILRSGKRADKKALEMWDKQQSYTTIQRRREEVQNLLKILCKLRKETLDVLQRRFRAKQNRGLDLKYHSALSVYDFSRKQVVRLSLHEGVRGIAIGEHAARVKILRITGPFS